MSSLEEIKQAVSTVKAGDNVPTTVAAYLKANLVMATQESSICVDGGYKPTEAMGELARAGADLGISEALMTLGLTPEKAFQAVYDYRVDHGQKYGWHSDTHAQHDENIFSGCGHYNATYQNLDRYQVSSEQVEELLVIVKQHQVEYPENMRYINLDREHAEEGIFVVLSPKVSVLPWDLETNRQFFVYDKTRDLELLTAIANTNDQIDTTELIKTVENQTNTTLGLLDSSKGKPLYSVEYNDGVVTVNQIGNAPTE